MCVRACVTLVPPLVPQALLGAPLPFLTLSPPPWCWLTCVAPPPLPRRTHLKECFETLKRNIPNVDDKKTSNLSVLRTALRYIQVWGREAPPGRGRQRPLPLPLPPARCPGLRAPRPPRLAAPPAPRGRRAHGLAADVSGAPRPGGDRRAPAREGKAAGALLSFPRSSLPPPPRPRRGARRPQAPQLRVSPRAPGAEGAGSGRARAGLGPQGGAEALGRHGVRGLGRGPFPTALAREDPTGLPG